MTRTMLAGVIVAGVIVAGTMPGTGAAAQRAASNVGGWSLQDTAKVAGTAAEASLPGYKPQGWYAATVPGTVLTTLVNQKVYPEPLYGENMRDIPESLNKATYWYRTTVMVPAANRGRHTWLHLAGVNYSAEVWVNGRQVGTMRGAFVRGDFDITEAVKPGATAAILVVVKPQPHPGVPHEHTQALGVGGNGGETALDGATFLSTIGWDWLPAVRDRDTGIWLPVTMDATGPVVVRDPVVASEVDLKGRTAELTVSATVENLSAKSIKGVLTGTIVSLGDGGGDVPVVFHKDVTVDASGKVVVRLDAKEAAALHLQTPKLWWPNGYGPQNLYRLELSFAVGKDVSSTVATNFGVRKIEYQVAETENLTISVNGVKVHVRGGNWGLDEAMKRVTRERLDAQFHLHALANLNMVRNWVGQSTGPDFYDMADKYGLLVWDEFFQPNPSDGPNVEDIPTYLKNVTEKVVRYRNHPSIAVWCARNEGYPPQALDDQLKALMGGPGGLDPTRLYQSNSADGRGVSSHGPYYWRSPRFFYLINESFKTETGSVSVPTIESIQGMMPKKDWETINDDWAQHDMARGAQRGDEYPFALAKRYGPIRNLADFVQKAQLANYEAYRAMYEGRNAEMFKLSSGVLTWMSHPAQPSFVWQLYHYDLEPNASLYGAQKAAETVHVQLNEENEHIEIVNNTPSELTGVKVRTTLYDLQSKPHDQRETGVLAVKGSSVADVAKLDVESRISEVYFAKLDLVDGAGKLLSTNFYWRNVDQDDFTSLAKLPRVTLDVTAVPEVEGEKTVLAVTVKNASAAIALMAHLQLHQKASGKRVLPAFASSNYLNLVPGEERTLTIEVATKNLEGDAPEILVDGFNVDVAPVDGAIAVGPNLNALPAHWPATEIVPMRP